MQFKEGNEVHWTTTPDSHRPHIGIPHKTKFQVRKYKGRFILKSNGILTPMFIYPIGISTSLAKAMEDEYVVNSKKEW